MATFAQLKTEIASDLDRSDLTTAINDAVLRAIVRFERYRWWFTEERDCTFASVADQAFYTVSDDTQIPLFVEIDNVWATEGGVIHRLEKIHPDRMEYLSDNSAASGRPYYWAYYEEKIRVYPVPADTSLTFRIDGYVKLTALSADGDTNGWTTYAKDLIRAEAKRDIALNKLRDARLAQDMELETERQFRNLRHESNSHVGTGYVEPYC